jgi:hypothetical protein
MRLCLSANKLNTSTGLAINPARQLFGIAGSETAALPLFRCQQSFSVIET